MKRGFEKARSKSDREGKRTGQDGREVKESRRSSQVKDKRNEGRIKKETV